MIYFASEEGVIYSYNPYTQESNYPGDIGVKENEVLILGDYDNNNKTSREIVNSYTTWPSLTALSLAIENPSFLEFSESINIGQFLNAGFEPKLLKDADCKDVIWLTKKMAIRDLEGNVPEWIDNNINMEGHVEFGLNPQGGFQVCVNALAGEFEDIDLVDEDWKKYVHLSGVRHPLNEQSLDDGFSQKMK